MRWKRARHELPAALPRDRRHVRPDRSVLRKPRCDGAEVMSEIFKHKFGGWREAEARRWTNPDGSEGGIVATSASIDKSVRIPVSVEVWPNSKIIGPRASIGDGASIGPRASIEKEDWLFVAGPQGSRKAWTTVTWSAEHGLRWWVGCQHGLSSADLLTRVNHEYPAGHPHGDDYRYLIRMVEEHPGLARHKAAAAEQVS